MKTEAPEKIYLEWYRIGDKKYRDWCIIPKTNDEPVEYTLTDAFIEKALAYLHNKFYFNNVFYGIVNTDFNAMEEMYEDFKNYMKGE